MDNWADEMDFNSHLICNDAEQKMLDDIRKYSVEDMKKTKRIYVGLGSNEDNEYDNVYQLYKNFNIYEIDDDVAKVIKKYFGRSLGAASLDYLLEDILNALKGVK